MRNTQRLRDTVAANARAELSRSRTSQRTAATSMGMSQAALSKRLNAYLPFTVDELEQLAELLNIPVSTLFAPSATTVPGVPA